MNDSPPSIDPTKPSVARAYDYVLGGKDNLEVDRKFADSVLAVDPDARTSAQLNKRFGKRVTEYFVRQGITQILDLGSGIPSSPPSVHETARQVRADTKVVYVDHDPVVASHNRALRATSEGLAALNASFSDPTTLFAHPELTAQLDPRQPTGVLLLSVFQNTEDSEVTRIVGEIRRHLAPGSYLAISHLSDRTAQSTKDQTARAAARYGYPPVKMRSDAQIAEFFTGFEIVEPGIVDYRDWHPDPDDVQPTLATVFTAAVGQLPG